MWTAPTTGSLNNLTGFFQDLLCTKQLTLKTECVHVYVYVERERDFHKYDI